MSAYFALTLFFSAALLFWIEPLVAKIILPLLGGTPAVWNTCMVFYQVALLVGYLYAHLSTRWLGVRRQSFLHLGLLFVSFLTLPVVIRADSTPPSATNPIPWLLTVLVTCIGFPFFLISATAPLLQKWFSQTGHPAEQDPYFLYSASNLGSMVALLSFPFLLEPYLRLSQQTWIWSLGYLVLGLLISGCALWLWRSQRPISTSLNRATIVGDLVHASSPVPGSAPPSLSLRLRWLLLSFCPSSLLLGVTTVITTDIAPVPLLWVVPLALYLLTFILVFARRPPISHAFVIRWQPALILPVTQLLFFGSGGYWWPAVLLHLLTFFALSMACHGELARSRPAATYLTEYYLYLSVGGVLGGLFNGLVAPLVFPTIIEYNLALVLACLLRPSLDSSPAARRTTWLDVGLPLLMGTLVASLAFTFQVLAFPPYTSVATHISVGLAIILCYLFRRRPLRFGLSIGAIMLAGTFMTSRANQTLDQERNFYGALKVVREDTGPQGSFHALFHGTTLHGAQSLDPNLRREPLTYFHRQGPLGEMFTSLASHLVDGRIAVCGLGIGTMASYAQPNQHWDFFEINPTVVEIALDREYFTFLEDCLAPYRIILGDARLSLARSVPDQYRLIVLDAFTSDAIPVHLLTREAFQVYLSRLAPSGVLVVHISNRFVDLKPVLGNLAENLDLVGLVQDRPVSQAEELMTKNRSIWVVMARQVEDLGDLVKDARWQGLTASGRSGLWTDDFSNIFRVLK